MIQPSLQVSHRYFRMPLKPGPRRYPLVEMKQTMPASSSGRSRCASNTFQVAHRQKYVEGEPQGHQRSSGCNDLSELILEIEGLLNDLRIKVIHRRNPL